MSGLGITVEALRDAVGAALHVLAAHKGDGIRAAEQLRALALSARKHGDLVQGELLSGFAEDLGGYGNSCASPGG